MVNVFGTEVPIAININGFLSSSWIYVFIVAVIGFLLITGVAIILFYRTYNRKIIVFDNVSGQGYQVAYKSRARVLKLGSGGEELLKTLFGGHYVSAYGRKMGKNQYWFAKGQDGYWYNILLGDLDTKLGVLDINPVDRDVRMFHVAVDKQARAQYEKKSNLERWVFAAFLLLLVIIFFVGMYVTWGRIGDATAPLADANQKSAATAETNAQTANQLAQIANKLGIQQPTVNQTGIGGSGLVPAS